MRRLSALAAVEARLLTRDWTVLVFAFAFPAFVMLILAGVFGTEPDDGYANQRPDDYYVVASIGVVMTALTLVGLPVALASYRERGVLRRFEAFGVSTASVVSALAAVTLGLILVGAAIALAVAAPTYGIPDVEHPWYALLGLAAGAVTLLLIGIAAGLAAPTARAAQAIGLLAFFPLYLLGGGGPPKGAMTDSMETVADALPSPITAITDPWLGVTDASSQLASLGVWAAIALLAIGLLLRRRRG
jgi:ABC-2 type transport system permease protein